MNSKEAIMEAAIALINEKEDRIEEITMREISKRAGVGLGLINYHFESKEELIGECVEKIVNGIVEKFRGMEAETEGMEPFEKLDYLGNITLTFLFEHQAVSKISMLSDMRFPKSSDNTQRTLRAYLPLVAQCRPDWDEERVYQMTFSLISSMQSAFLRHEILLEQQGINLKNTAERKLFHRRMLENMIGTQNAEKG
ncbi:MAG: helix-turn-helix domain-containing protein [Lachnospiraceae bacterium]|nr:helix-turn-helix domain-containing protein [Lachnospiraceae bacterium]